MSDIRNAKAPIDTDLTDKTGEPVRLDDTVALIGGTTGTVKMYNGTYSIEADNPIDYNTLDNLVYSMCDHYSNFIGVDTFLSFLRIT